MKNKDGVPLTKRNIFAFDPLMMKGCAHGKTNKASRRKDKVNLRSQSYTD